MPIKSEWDLDPGSGDFYSVLSLDLNGVDDTNEQNVFYYNGMGVDEICKKSATDQFFDPSNSESEFYSNPWMNSNPLPNDDIWKKFDILDMGDKYDFDDELSDVFPDLTNLTWAGPMYAQSVANNAREIRNHDCMWAGHCISEKHDRNNQKNLKCVNLLPIKKSQSIKSEEVEVVAVTTSDGTITTDGNRVCGRKSAVVAPTHARSILLPTRVVNATSPPMPQAKKSANSRNNATTKRLNRSRTLDSGGESPRPETPQSLSDNEDLNLDLPDMKTVEDFVVDTYGYNFGSDLVQNVGSEDSNTDESGDDFSMYLFDRYQQLDSTNSSGASTPCKVAGNKVKRTVMKQEVPISRHYTMDSFFSDHCYHLNKNARMDNLGVQTPSDSEEEIDVETVYGDTKKPNSRSSSSGAGLPTNPSLSDRQQLQLTVASAISKKDVKKQSERTTSLPNRYSLDERTLKPKMIPCKRKINVRNEVRRTGGSNKRSAQFDDYSEYINKSVKRKKYQYQRHYKTGKGKKARNARSSARNIAGGSSDSEVDSIERRTIHNSMERQRRIDLRNSFEELRKLIPHTAGNEKAAKVVILSHGAEFCKSLALEDSELTRKKAELRRQQEMLMARVSQLRRSLAAQR